MTDIRKSVQLFNEALPLAWSKMEGVPLDQRVLVGRRLSELVRSSIRAGLEDPAAIVEAVLKQMKPADRGTEDIHSSFLGRIT
jgi:hypothetical protein